MTYSSTSPIWPSLERANAQVLCRRAAQHWWLVDNRALAQMGNKVPKYIPCYCKACGENIKLALDAKEIPK